MTNKPNDNNTILNETLILMKQGAMQPQTQYPYARFTAFALAHFIPTQEGLSVETAFTDIIAHYRTWAKAHPYKHEAYLTDAKLVQYMARHALCLGVGGDVFRRPDQAIAIQTNRVLSASGLAPAQMPLAAQDLATRIRAQLPQKRAEAPNTAIYVRPHGTEELTPVAEMVEAVLGSNFRTNSFVAQTEPSIVQRSRRRENERTR